MLTSCMETDCSGYDAACNPASNRFATVSYTGKMILPNSITIVHHHSVQMAAAGELPFAGYFANSMGR